MLETEDFDKHLHVLAFDLIDGELAERLTFRSDIKQLFIQYRQAQANLTSNLTKQARDKN